VARQLSKLGVYVIEAGPGDFDATKRIAQIDGKHIHLLKPPSLPPSLPQVARQLSKLGVDVIEAGFPIASPGDFDAVKRIAQTVGNTHNPPIICGLARALHKDIETCWEAVKHAAFPRIHTFIATSDIHMLHKLKKSRAQVH